jgi:hypothetical protein
MINEISTNNFSISILNLLNKKEYLEIIPFFKNYLVKNSDLKWGELNSNSNITTKSETLTNKLTSESSNIYNVWLTKVQDGELAVGTEVQSNLSTLNEFILLSQQKVKLPAYIPITSENYLYSPATYVDYSIIRHMVYTHKYATCLKFLESITLYVNSEITSFIRVLDEELAVMLLKLMDSNILKSIVYYLQVNNYDFEHCVIVGLVLFPYFASISIFVFFFQNEEFLANFIKEVFKKLNTISSSFQLIIPYKSIDVSGRSNLEQLIINGQKASAEKAEQILQSSKVTQDLVLTTKNQTASQLNELLKRTGYASFHSFLCASFGAGTITLIAYFKLKNLIHVPVEEVISALSNITQDLANPQNGPSEY